MPLKSQIITTEQKVLPSIDNFDNMTLEEMLECVDNVFKNREVNFKKSVMKILRRIK